MHTACMRAQCTLHSSLWSSVQCTVTCVCTHSCAACMYTSSRCMHVNTMVSCVQVKTIVRWRQVHAIFGYHACMRTESFAACRWTRASRHGGVHAFRTNPRQVVSGSTFTDRASWRSFTFQHNTRMLSVRRGAQPIACIAWLQTPVTRARCTPACIQCTLHAFNQCTFRTLIQCTLHASMHTACAHAHCMHA